MDWNEQRLLIKIAKMYYDEDLTQNQIAKQLGIYRTTIGRMLKKARAEGIVTIQINSDDDRKIALEEKIASAFNMQEVLIAPSAEGEDEVKKREEVGKAAAELLKRVVEDHDIVGVAWGNTIGSMVDHLPEFKEINADFVPLVGGPGKMNTNHHINTIVYKLSQAFKGNAHFIDAAAVYNSKETRNDIMQSSFFQEIHDLWERLSVGIVGIGAPIRSSNMIWTGFFGDSEINILEQHHAVGDICSRFYDIEGNVIESELSERTIAVELSKLKELRYSIGVAESIEKVESIIGALRGGFINTLVTNEETAEEIIKHI
ncbi:sugar-binding transcriptional regulator [Pseudalkalibacillus hwajinpoensis]|uniref:sugar-binding transcriptional regulator n=1 Tax=Guptibacillus hwajinpoensis TaxID=208199 RepID=UPI00325A7B78